ncbi:hypothetical protein PG997_011383 [Apiospora hydei]|uniref:Uncharacterized protein n=1 Tax=Apiospora hydei TaxID=1337664 RepID=A0ABR1VLT8_9PEZI
MTQSKADQIEEVRSNLPKPEDPRADGSATNVGSGGVSSDVSTGAGSSSGLREPASTKEADLSNVGREGKDNLSGPPKDAAAK